MASKGARVPLSRGTPAAVELATDKSANGKRDVVMLAVRLLRRDGGTQNRVGMRAETLESYREIMLEAEGWGPFPPVEATYDGIDYWLTNGFHRVEVALSIDPETLAPVEVTPGTLKDAVLASLSANHTNGLQRTNPDKRKAVIRCLTDQDYGWHALTDHVIADFCKVSPRMVGAVRADLEHAGRIERQDVRIGKDGRAINTNGIGRPHRHREETVQVESPGGGEDIPVLVSNGALEAPAAQLRRVPILEIPPQRVADIVYPALPRGLAADLYEATQKGCFAGFITPPRVAELERLLRLVLTER